MPNERVPLSQLAQFTPKQLFATQMADKYGYLLYGGAAGGGKSYWLRWYTIRWLINKFTETGQKGIVAGLFCEDYPALKDRHVGKMAMEFPEWLGTLSDSKVYGLSFQLSQDLGGGVIALRNLDDIAKYLSSEFALVAVDELTRNTEATFNTLRMRKRWPGLTKTQFIAGTNPGEIGHEWVKKRWIEKDFPSNEKEAEEFYYVPATVDDNPHLARSYLDALDSEPDEKKRKAYREGNWDIFEGQFFTEFDKEQHVVDWFEIPDSWVKFRSIDVSGRNGITSCHWYAVDWDGTVWVYDEHYATGLDSDQHAAKIAEKSTIYDPYGTAIGYDRYKYTVMDSAAFAKLGVPESVAEIYERCKVTGLVPSSKNRVAGWDIVHQYLRWKPAEGGAQIQPPKLRIMRNCVNLIRTLPTLIHDEGNKNDVDTRGEDHAADELRYLLQTLRAGKSPKAMTVVEKRLKELKNARRAARANNRYR